MMFIPILLASTLLRSPVQLDEPATLIQFLKKLPAHPTIGDFVNFEETLHQPAPSKYVSASTLPKVFALVDALPADRSKSRGARVRGDGTAPCRLVERDPTVAWPPSKGYVIEVFQPDEVSLFIKRPENRAWKTSIPVSLPISALFIRSCADVEGTETTGTIPTLKKALGAPVRTVIHKGHDEAVRILTWQVKGRWTATYNSFMGLIVDFTNR